VKIALLIHNVYGIGGTIRTTLNLAAALAGDHEVEVVSMFRHRAEPRFAVDPRVTVVPLVDLRPDSPDVDDPLSHQPATVFPAGERRYRQYSRLTDRRAQDYLRHCDADVIIGTRPGVNVYLARFGPRRALRIAQEHLTHDAHGGRLRAALAAYYPSLDALVTTTEADAATYRARMRLPGVRVLAVPNIVPDPGIPPSDGAAPVVAAAGRLVPRKHFDLLIEAFAELAAKYPGWSLRIYGGGSEREHLQGLIEERDLGGQVALMGSRAPIEAEFAQASIVASASEAESFGMTLVEAMRCGVPVISTDAPLGPAEIIDSGVDGILVPVGDRRALTAALEKLIADEGTRRRMGEAALLSARRFDPAPIARTYGKLFAELSATRRFRGPSHHYARWRFRLRRRVRALLRD
jgi:glycosyltransferase involved in cell wall biosynthesis